MNLIFAIHYTRVLLISKYDNLKSLQLKENFYMHVFFLLVV